MATGAAIFSPISYLFFDFYIPLTLLTQRYAIGKVSCPCKIAESRRATKPIAQKHPISCPSVGHLNIQATIKR